jgi:hypothetical protein
MTFKALPNKSLQFSADYQRQTWHAEVPNDTLLEEVLMPAFWVHVAARIKAHALIDVVTKDGLLDLQLRVTSIEGGIVVVRPRFVYEDKEARQLAIAVSNLQNAEIESEAAPSERRRPPEGYKVGFNPAKKTYYAQFKGTGQKIAEGLASWDKGVDACEAHDKKLRTPAKAA